MGSVGGVARCVASRSKGPWSQPVWSARTCYATHRAISTLVHTRTRTRAAPHSSASSLHTLRALLAARSCRLALGSAHPNGSLKTRYPLLIWLCLRSSSCGYSGQPGSPRHQWGWCSLAPPSCGRPRGHGLLTRPSVWILPCAWNSRVQSLGACYCRARAPRDGGRWCQVGSRRRLAHRVARSQSLG